jgi:hypothetical protein
MTETSNPSGPGPAVSFATDIGPLFRDQDQQAMSWAFDLSSYEDVRAHAGPILGKLANGSMPCDGAWPADKVELFRQWTQTGMQP